MNDLHCRILYIRHEDLDRSWAYHLGNPWWRLYRAEAAGVIIRHPQGELRLPAGRLCLVPAWGAFSGRCVSPTRKLYIHFDPLGWDRGWQQRAFPLPFLVTPDAGRDAFIAGLDDPLSAADRMRLQGEVLRMLASAVAGLPEGLREELNHRDPLDRASEWLEGMLAHPPTVPQMAARCGWSPDHFARCFRARFGCSPQVYVQQRRVALAGERLRATGDSIDEVAASVGFANRFHFTRVFTQHMGLSPARWRTAHQATSTAS